MSSKRTVCHLFGLVLVTAPAMCGWEAVADAKDPPAGETSFYRDVAPILFARCANCHRPEGAAPFSLLTFEDARRRATQIATVTKSRFMPPWLPEEGHEAIGGDRQLSDDEIGVLAAWVAAGTPEGDAKDAPAAPVFHAGWQLGEPNLVLESPEFELPADGPDRFRNFLLAVPGGLDHWVRAVELRPENPRVTHSARLGIDTDNESARRDAADPEVGYEGMAWGADPAGQLITWTPGMTPDAGTPGAAWQLTSDAKLVLHTHLQPSGKPETVRFRIGFYFADKSPTVKPMILRVGSRDIDIPANVADHKVTDEYVVPIDVDVCYVFPHAHSLARGIELRAMLPDGESRTLIAIRKFNESWHDTYRFAKPVRLPRGTKLHTEFTYDNTAANVRNPHHPPVRVVYGSNADDEMADVYMQVVPVDATQYAVLTEQAGLVDLQSKIVGYRKALELHAGDLWSAEALASSYVAARQPAGAIRLLESRPALLESSVQARVILGMARFAARDVEGAEQDLRAALAMDEEFSLAWLGLGQVLAAKAEAEGAEQALRRAIELAPRSTVARLDLVDLLGAVGRIDEAAAECELAAKIAPDDYKPELKWANVLSQQQEYEASLRHFAAARRLAPWVYSPQASLAIVCYQLGDEAEADRLLADAVANDPADPVPYCYLGQIARRNGQVDAAAKYFEKASQLPTPRAWPASHERQFRNLIEAETRELAKEREAGR